MHNTFLLECFLSNSVTWAFYFGAHLQQTTAGADEAFAKNNSGQADMTNCKDVPSMSRTQFDLCENF